jgi:hypothetical protein
MTQTNGAERLVFVRTPYDMWVGCACVMSRVCATLQWSWSVCVHQVESSGGVSRVKSFGVQVRLMGHRGLLLRKVVSNECVGIGSEGCRGIGKDGVK